MASCTIDLSWYPSVEVREGCDRPEVLEQAVRDAATYVDLGDGRYAAEDAYVLDRSFAWPITVIGGVFAEGGELRIVGGGLTLEGTTVRRPLLVEGLAAATLRGTTHSDVIRATAAALTLDGAELRDAAWVDATDTLLTVRGGDWRGLESPVLQVLRGSLWLEGTSISDTRIAGDREVGEAVPGDDGLPRVIALYGAVGVVRYAWLCDHEASAIGGTCGLGTCRVDHTVLHDVDEDAALVSPAFGTWRLDHVTLHHADERPGGWGLRVGPDATVEATRTLVWPDDPAWAEAATDALTGDWDAVRLLGRGDLDDRLGELPTACAPSVPDPAPFGYDASDVPGAFTLPATRSAWAYHAPWLADDPSAGGDAYGLGDGDGIVRMWDCAPDDPEVGGPEVPGNLVDEDCDGTVSCWFGEDHDGDGFGVYTEVSAGTPECPGADGPIDPDDRDPCVVPEGEDPPCSTGTHTGEPGTGTGSTSTDTDLDPQIVGLSGSGCATAPGGAGWVLAALLAARRRRS